MAEKTIPCRVCGKQFKPCGFCQSHSDTFRWRNFACSIECAQKYIAETIAYREQKRIQEEKIDEPKNELTFTSSAEEPLVTSSAEEIIIEEIEKEQPIIEDISQKKKKKIKSYDGFTE